MFIEERHEVILDMINKEGKVNVKELSKTFNISESMIRKDLQSLEKNGKLKRTYGGAIQLERTLVDEEDFIITRVYRNREAKSEIAHKALDLIQDDDIIFLDISSTSYLLAKMLVNSNKNITIITNMPLLASMIKSTNEQKFIFIGGDYNTLAGGNIGSQAIEQISKYRCSKCFIGCIGINLDDGSLTALNSEDSHTKKAIMDISKESYLFAPSMYFKQDGLFNFANLIDFKGVITEIKPDDKTMSALNQYGVEVI